MRYGNLRTMEFGKLCDRDFVKEQLSDLTDKSEQPVLCCGDNRGAIAITRNPVLHKRSKHINVSCHLAKHAYGLRWTLCLMLRLRLECFVCIIMLTMLTIQVNEGGA